MGIAGAKERLEYALLNGDFQRFYLRLMEVGCAGTACAQLLSPLQKMRKALRFPGNPKKTRAKLDNIRLSATYLRVRPTRSFATLTPQQIAASMTGSPAIQ
jgi:hypothetical protein